MYDLEQKYVQKHIMLEEVRRKHKMLPDGKVCETDCVKYYRYFTMHWNVCLFVYVFFKNIVER